MIEFTNETNLKMHDNDEETESSDAIPFRELFRDLIEKKTELGLYISGIRHREMLTQKKLAALFGCSARQISRWENGKVVPSQKQLKRLGDILNSPYMPNV